MSRPITGENLDERPLLTLEELCRACSVEHDWLIALVEEGVLTPSGEDRTRWRFYGVSVRRVRVARRLQRDLGVNLAGVALALELMDEIDTLRERLGKGD